MYVTTGLAELLLELASDRDPTPVTIPLAVTAAGDFESLDLPVETAVFTHLYFPDAGRSVSWVFGVDLGTPAARTPGVFVSHPAGALAVDETDTLREVVLVGVPPWVQTSLAAFGRDGARRPLELVAADPPEESLP